ncbi:hypothetical protein VNO78_13261 [Psophocarpus tetragonolobus]|uniref:Bulb-type lectin domain-containing protein n=1 Tax=Psophocarpus tetragonolobus TaxID=3891 RepID=A0AAN9SP89_PSOTE
MIFSPLLIFAWLCLQTTTHATTARDSLRPDRTNTTGYVDWIANNHPFVHSSVALKLNHFGALILTSRNDDPIILYSPVEATNRTIATLLDSGNLVLREVDGNDCTKSVLWQSFDHPASILLSGMKLGVNKRTGMSWIVKASISGAKLALGSFTLEWEPREGQLVKKRQGQVYWASGLLKNKIFENIPKEVQLMYEYNIVSNEDEESFSYSALNNISQLVLFHNAAATLLIVIAFLCIFYIILRRRKAALKDNTTRTENKMLKLVTLDRHAASKLHSEVKKRSDLRVFSYASIMAMTNKFSIEKKLGEGGFGPVYKMSPEYAMRGIFSIKSDVYSFGVMMIEIVSGGRSTNFYNGERQCILIGYAWELWQQGSVLELANPTIMDSCIEDQALRCIHVGLLRAEDDAVDRPTISDTINMLTSEYASFPLPRRPAFYSRRKLNEECRSTNGSECYSVNGLSISNVDPR